MLQNGSDFQQTRENPYSAVRSVDNPLMLVELHSEWSLNFEFNTFTFVAMQGSQCIVYKKGLVKEKECYVRDGLAVSDS